MQERVRRPLKNGTANLFVEGVRRHELDAGNDGALRRKLMNCSHGQELGQPADLTSDCFFTLV